MGSLRTPRCPAAIRRRPIRLLAIAAALLGGLIPVTLPAAAPTAAACGHPAGADGGAPLQRGGPSPGLTPAAGSGSAAGRGSGSAPSPLPDHDWLWPAEGARSVIVPFRAPAHDYGPGHRGMDIAAIDDVRAPADGVVAYLGTVVDRPLLTIDHGNGLVTTLEPAQSALAPGATVHRGDVIATVSTGGHTPAGALHIGVRWNGVYVNPMLLFGDVPRAVLLPCGSRGC
ncbi:MULTISPECIES: murein hydrolase activator EnvC family protein [unclassified Microbacterium]|uniref:murein hydrolase activator EnvC family protein n=1 Tax=unclassified Microbacterium TaxID=2609290 RepID=UPI00365B6AE9